MQRSSRLPAAPWFWLATSLLLVAIAAGALLLTADHRHEVLGGDGPEYGRYAKNLLDHGVYSSQAAPPYEPNVGRTPGYPFFLAAVRLLGGDSVLLVRLAQFALLGLMAVLVYRIALRIGTRSEARVAALLVLTYLPLIWLARFQLTEVLASALACAVVLLLLPSSNDAPSPSSRYAAIGLLLGLATLVRPGYGLVVLPLAVALALSRASDRQWLGWKSAAILLGVFALTLAPWAVRNAITADAFVPLGAQSGISLYASAKQYEGTISPALTQSDFERLRSNARAVVRPTIAEERRKTASTPLSPRVELASDRAYRSEARSIMGGVSPGEMIKRLPRRVAYLWAPSDFPPAATYSSWHRIAQLQHAALLVLGLMGLAVLIRRHAPWSRIWPLLLFAVYLTGLHLLFHVEARYTMPARPMLLVFSAIGAAAVFQLLLRLGKSRRSGLGETGG